MATSISIFKQARSGTGQRNEIDSKYQTNAPNGPDGPSNRSGPSKMKIQVVHSPSSLLDRPLDRPVKPVQLDRPD